MDAGERVTLYVHLGADEGAIALFDGLGALRRALRATRGRFAALVISTVPPHTSAVALNPSSLDGLRPEPIPLPAFDWHAIADRKPRGPNRGR
jgi:hypothetical protein